MSNFLHECLILKQKSTGKALIMDDIWKGKFNFATYKY